MLCVRCPFCCAAPVAVTCRCHLSCHLPCGVCYITELVFMFSVLFLVFWNSITVPVTMDLSKGRRFVLLYTDLIGPSVEYEDNVDSRVLKTFLVQTLNGINNYVFSKDDIRLVLPHENVSQMTFWLKFNTGELITPDYPIILDLRIE